MRVVSIALAAFAIFRLDPCSGGGGDGGGTGGGGTATEQPQPGTGATGGTGGTGGTTTQPGQNTAAVNVPAVFYEEWAYTTATSYADPNDPTVTSSSGKQVFTRELTYTQDYYIGSFSNHYEGTYRVLGPDPRVTGGFLLETTDQDAQKETWGVAVDEGSKAMAMTLYEDDGSTPAVIFGLKLIEK
jgi:hypothetical protein